MLFWRNRVDDPRFDILAVDCHSHLLPFLDDGSKSVFESIQLVVGLTDLGFKKLITTPHIMSDMYPNTPEIIFERLLVLNQALADKGIDLELTASAEYFLDDQMEARIHANGALLTLPGKRVLCEFSMLSPTSGIREMIFEMQMQGYQVIIAHPERYVYLESNKGFYDELKDMGCLFQLNLLALGNYYGKTVSGLAQYLTKKGFYDFAATDLHNHRHLELLRDPKIGEGLKRLMDTCRIRNAELV